jgi:hypothetical protein
MRPCGERRAVWGMVQAMGMNVAHPRQGRPRVPGGRVLGGRGRALRSGLWCLVLPRLAVRV